MDKQSLVLAILSAGNGGEFSPVQVQKLFFLVDKNIPRYVGGPHFNFSPYDYGPFDKAVYGVLEKLGVAGFLETCEVPGRSWPTYRLTQSGQSEGQALLSRLPEKVITYIKDLVEFVRTLSFEELVSAIYRAYPEMKVNSVFRD